MLRTGQRISYRLGDRVVHAVVVETLGVVADGRQIVRIRLVEGGDDAPVFEVTSGLLEALRFQSQEGGDPGAPQANAQ